MSEEGSFLRLASVALRRYTRDPDQRPAAARLLASAAICLLAEETSPGEAALSASETLAQLAQRQRRDFLAVSEAAKAGASK